MFIIVQSVPWEIAKINQLSFSNEFNYSLQVLVKELSFVQI